MEAIFILIPISLIFLGLMIAAFFWASGDQFDALDEESKRPLEEDEDHL